MRSTYGPDHRLPVKVATRNIAQYRDPAIILIDQMKEIYIDGELDPVETANWFPKIARKDFMVGANLSGSGVDDPDAYFTVMVNSIFNGWRFDEAWLDQ